MRIIQLINVDGEQAGLYCTERTDNQKVDLDIEECFQLAQAKEEHYLEMEYEEEINVQELADEYLEQRGINRVFSDEVYITQI